MQSAVFRNRPGLVAIGAATLLLSACAASGPSAEREARSGRTILTEGASAVIAEEGRDSDNLICRNQRLPGSYRMVRICQSTQEYEEEVAENRRMVDDWRSRGAPCTSECGIEDGGN